MLRAGESCEIIEDMATVLKVSVLANGTVLLDGNPVTPEALAEALDGAPKDDTAVWYYRENAAGEAPAAAIPVMKLIVERRLPLRLYTRPDFLDGLAPDAGLIDVKGTLYGTTTGGGGSSNCSGGCGTIFSIATSGKEKILHSFGGSTDGATPIGRLTKMGSALYGTTSAGGASNNGSVFELSLQ